MALLQQILIAGLIAGIVAAIATFLSSRVPHWRALALFSALSFGLSLFGLAFWFMFEIPDPATLVTVEGTVIEAGHRNSRSKDWVFVVAPRNRAFVYTNWYPEYEQVRANLIPGVFARVETSSVDALSKPGDVWSLAAPSVSVPFGRIARAKEVNARFGLAIGIAFFIGGTYLGLQARTARKTAV